MASRKKVVVEEETVQEDPGTEQPELEATSADEESESPPTTQTQRATAERTGSSENPTFNQNPYSDDEEESDKPSTKKTFSQEEVDEIVRKRLARERSKTSKAEEASESLSSEVTQLQTKQETTESELRAQKKAAKALQSELTQARLENALIVEAQKQGIDAEAAARLVNYDQVQMGEEGEWLNLSDLVQGVGERFPGLKTGRGTSPSRPVNPPADATQSTPAESDADRYRRYFMGGGGRFFNSSNRSAPGVVFNGNPEDLE